MTYLVEIFIPFDPDIAAASYDDTKQELVDRFGGLTLNALSPAEGLWRGGSNDVETDRIITAEVMVSELDRVWWIAYRKTLEVRFHQEEILIRATTVEKL